MPEEHFLTHWTFSTSSCHLCFALITRLVLDRFGVFSTSIVGAVQLRLPCLYPWLSWMLPGPQLLCKQTYFFFLGTTCEWECWCGRHPELITKLEKIQPNNLVVYYVLSLERPYVYTQHSLPDNKMSLLYRLFQAFSFFSCSKKKNPNNFKRKTNIKASWISTCWVVFSYKTIQHRTKRISWWHYMQWLQSTLQQRHDLPRICCVWILTLSRWSCLLQTQPLWPSRFPTDLIKGVVLQGMHKPMPISTLRPYSFSQS